MLAPWKESYDQPRQHIKKQRHYFVNKGLSSQGCGFSSSHVWIDSWTIKKVEHRRTDAFELWCWRRLLRVHWTARRSNQSILKEISPGCSLEGLIWAETPVLLPPNAKSWLICKDPDPGKDWGQEEKGTTEGEMVGWHHWLNGHGFGWTLGVGDRQGGLACCGSQGRKESETIGWLIWYNRLYIGPTNKKETDKYPSGKMSKVHKQVIFWRCTQIVKEQKLCGFSSNQKSVG